MSLREKLTNHLREGHGFISSGDLQRMEWKDSHGALATPSNISRRLRELEVDGVLEVQTRKGPAHYRLAQKVPTLFQ
jgi:DNA-binding HxlR family transcriptional regulator